MAKIFAKAITHKGFSVVEVLSQCPTYYGRKNHKGDAVEMMRFFKEEAGKSIPVGIIKEEERIEYSRAYRERVLEPAARRAGRAEPDPAEALAATRRLEPGCGQ